jgi:hypothetical protein
MASRKRALVEWSERDRTPTGSPSRPSRRDVRTSSGEGRARTPSSRATQQASNARRLKDTSPTAFLRGQTGQRNRAPRL